MNELLATSLSDIIEEVKVDKNLAQSYVKAENFEQAAKILTRATTKIKPYVDLEDGSSSSPSRMEKHAAALLADCYGSLGGVLRRNRQFLASADAYDKGFQIESHQLYGIVNSYNLVQRLVARILASDALLTSPTSLEQLPVPQNSNVLRELQAADQQIERHLDDSRYGDLWAMADQAMTRLLIGDYKRANDAWNHFIESKPPFDVYKSTRDVIALLIPKFSEGSFKHQLEECLARLEKEIERLKLP